MIEQSSPQASVEFKIIPATNNTNLDLLIKTLKEYSREELERDIFVLHVDDTRQ